MKEPVDVNDGASASSAGDDADEIFTTEELHHEGISMLGGYFRGLAVALRSLAPTAKIAAKALSGSRPLAFASEVGVASKPILPPWLYKSTWGLSLAAVGADIGIKVADTVEGERGTF